MHIRDLLNLVLRIYGISILLFNVFPLFISNMGFLLEAFRFNEPSMTIYALGIMILPFIAALVLIFGSSWLIDLLKLDRGFQSHEILLSSTSSQQLLQLAIIILGGYLIVDNISASLAHLVEAFRVSLHHFKATSYHNFWKSGLTIFIGALLISNREVLARWLMPKTEG